jgi:hypothetical protein
MAILWNQGNHHGFKMSLKILGMILEGAEKVMGGIVSKVGYKIGSNLGRIKAINHGNKEDKQWCLGL